VDSETHSLANPGCSTAIAHGVADFLALDTSPACVRWKAIRPDECFVLLGHVTNEYKKVSSHRRRVPSAFSAPAYVVRRDMNE
jgi:hypothetical protein